MPNVPTEQLIAQARQGDARSLHMLLEQAEPLALQLARRHLDESGVGGLDATDVAKHTCRQARRRIDSFAGSTEDEWIAWIGDLVRHAMTNPEAPGQSLNRQRSSPNGAVEPSRDDEIEPPEDTDGHLSPTVTFRPGSTGNSQPSTLSLRDEPVLPKSIGNYELLEVIGRGGMGVVCRARQTTLNRIVAVKMILHGSLASEDDVRRFYSEAQAAGKLDHPNIVTIHQVGHADGHHFFSMDFVDGKNLAELAAEGPLPPERIAGHMRTIAEAIQYAHENGILHRDLKPANVLIDGHDCPRITDFGLAKPMGTDHGLTATGTTVGTPSYMPPEQASGQGDRMDQRSDVYSLGAVLYELLTGRPPFRANTAAATIMEVLHKEPVPPRELAPHVDRDLETICLKCLRKDRAKRYRSAQELADECGRFLSGQPIRAKPIGHLRRTWHWVREIPLVAALVGRKTLSPTRWQRRTQWLMLAVLLTALVSVLARGLLPEPLPRQIRVATAQPAGMYHAVGTALQPALTDRVPRQVTLRETHGSVENLELLLRRKVELAILQGSSVTSDQIAAVAPLFFEPVHLVVRRDATEIRTIRDLREKRVSLGPVGSGMRQTSLKLLAYFGVSVDSLQNTESRFTDLGQGDELVAAIVTTGLQNPELIELLGTGRFRLLDVDDGEITFKRPSFRPFAIRPDYYPEMPDFPTSGVSTIASTALLAVRSDASERLVLETLEALYSSQVIEDVPGRIGLLEAASWTTLPWHSAAHRFFDAHLAGSP